MSEDVNSSQKGPRLGFSVRSPRDFWGGLVLILVAILALWAARDLPGQRGFAFGPGTAPRLFAGILAVLGAGVALIGLFVDGPRIEKYKVRGPVLVIIAIFLFAALIRPFGLVVATYLAFIVSISGSNEVRWIEAIIAAAAMTVGCILLFVYLLNLPFQLWPQPNAPVLLLHQFQELIQGAIALFQKAPPRP
jgi:putative tricarboxylic transport membrane protein